VELFVFVTLSSSRYLWQTICAFALRCLAEPAQRYTLVFIARVQPPSYSSEVHNEET